MFRKEADFEAFERVMVLAYERQPIRILSYCVLSNHWHFVAWPEQDGQLTDFFRRLAHTHAMRWRVSHRTVGYGHLYQGKLCRSCAWSTPFVRRVGHASQASLGRIRKADCARAPEISSPKQTTFVSVSFTWRQTSCVFVSVPWRQTNCVLVSLQLRPCFRPKKIASSSQML